MCILFYTSLYPDIIVSGGIGRITSRLSLSLRQRGIKTYCLYTHKYELKQTDNQFNDVLFIPENKIVAQKELVAEYITEHNIDIVVCQMLLSNIELLSYLRTQHQCRVIYVNHMMPTVEYSWVNFDKHVKPEIINLFSKPTSFSHFFERIKEVKRKMVYLSGWKKKVSQMYYQIYDSCDRYVVLSDSFRQLLHRQIGIRDLSKVVSIPNMLSYDEFLPDEDIYKKEKVVLIVARMHEQDKQISKALKYWKVIEEDERFNDWHLDVVGDGPSLEEYRQYTSKNLNRVIFYGAQDNPKSFYKRASLFLMTSRSEGFGITLIETLQFGCVPIVLNTFSAAKDIISNGYNGFLVESDRQYIKCLKRLMSEAITRENMAKASILSSKKFGKENVTDMWISLFDDLVANWKSF